MKLLLGPLLGYALLVGVPSTSLSEEKRKLLDFSVIHISKQYAPERPEYAVIYNSKQWKQFQEVENINGPKIDFSRFLLVVAATGQKPSSGYSVAITAAEDAAVEGGFGQVHATTIAVLDVGPGSCPQLTELGRPRAVFALIPRKNEGVKFRIHHVGADCSEGASRDQLIELIVIG